MLTDTHCHLDDSAYEKDLSEVLKRAEDLSFILIPGCDIASSKRAVQIADTIPDVYAAVGIHPSVVGNYSKEDRKVLKDLAKHKKVLAIGEIGLDFHYPDNPDADKQKAAFRDQIKLAQELSLPYIVHDRDAHQEVLKIIEEFPDVKCVVHSFSGDLNFARKLLEAGNYISVNGILTFKNAGNLIEVVREVPLDRILIETDGPYLTPVPFRGKRNEPGNTRYIAKALARIKDVPIESVLARTEQNARNFFEVEF